MAYGSGLARVIAIELKKEANVIPVDVTANYIIAAAWYSATELFAKGVKEVPVFNCAVGDHKAATWGTWDKSLNAAFSKYPLETNTLRRPKVRGISPKLWHSIAIRKYFLHTVPAYLYDSVLRLFGKKPMMMRLFNKMERSFAELRFFTSNEWQWEDRRSKDIMTAMNDADKVTFSLDLRPLHWPTYIENMVIGIKKYMLKENVESFAKARRIAFRHYIISMVLKAFFLWVIYKVVVPYLRSLGLTKSMWMAMVPAFFLVNKYLLAKE